MKGYDSISSKIFEIAYRRVWRSKALQFWEIFFWSCIAVILGFAAYGYLFITFLYMGITLLIVMYLFFVPVTVGVWSYQIHEHFNLPDEVIRSTPMPASEIINARIKAVWLTIIRVYGPPTILFVATFTVLLAVQSYRFRQTNFSEIFAYISSAILFIAWFAFPVYWGVYTGCVSGRDSGSFFLKYYSYIIYFILSIAIPILLKWFFIFDKFELWLIVVGLTGLTASYLIYRKSLDRWHRRDL